jgi:hypothetical protein
LTAECPLPGGDTRSAKSGDSIETAISAPLVGAVFHPPNFGSKRPIRTRRSPAVVQQLIGAIESRAEALELLSKELGWSTTPSNLKAYLRYHNLKAPWLKPKVRGVKRIERPYPSVVQEFIRNATTREEAVRILKDELDWATSPNALSTYLKRHDLHTLWQRKILKEQG